MQEIQYNNDQKNMMSGEGIIEYLTNVRTDVITGNDSGNDTGNFSNFQLFEKEVLKNINNLEEEYYVRATNLIDEINEEYYNNFYNDEYHN